MNSERNIIINLCLDSVIIPTITDIKRSITAKSTAICSFEYGISQCFIAKFSNTLKKCQLFGGIMFSLACISQLCKLFCCSFVNWSHVFLCLTKEMYLILPSQQSIDHNLLFFPNKMNSQDRFLR